MSSNRRPPEGPPPKGAERSVSAPSPGSVTWSPPARGAVERRMQRVLDHVYDHLDEPLDLNRLADIACLSPYHWHRVYRAMRGETIAATVQRLRLQRAADLLANSPVPIERVADVYRNDPARTAPADLEVAICLPLAAVPARRGPDARVPGERASIEVGRPPARREAGVGESVR